MTIIECKRHLQNILGLFIGDYHPICPYCDNGKLGVWRDGDWVCYKCGLTPSVESQRPAPKGDAK